MQYLSEHEGKIYLGGLFVTLEQFMAALSMREQLSVLIFQERLLERVGCMPLLARAPV
jgi:hypothetical protein